MNQFIGHRTIVWCFRIVRAINFLYDELIYKRFKKQHH